MSFKFKVFLLLIPLFVLFGSGVLVRSTKVSVPVYGCVANDLSGMPQDSQVANYGGKFLTAPEIAYGAEPVRVLGQSDPQNRWIDIDLSKQELKAWDGNSLFLKTPVSTGIPVSPTPVGEFHVWVKLLATKMEGGEGRYYYDLPNVPYVMYLANDQVPEWKGYGIRGAYWQSDFGKPNSYGCIDTPTDVAEKLYYWATPNLQADRTSAFASAENPGIKVVIHE